MINKQTLQKTASAWDMVKDEIKREMFYLSEFNEEDFSPNHWEEIFSGDFSAYNLLKNDHRYSSAFTELEYEIISTINKNMAVDPLAITQESVNIINAFIAVTVSRYIHYGLLPDWTPSNIFFAIMIDDDIEVLANYNDSPVDTNESTN